MRHKHAFILFIFIVLAISIPLTLVIRAKIDLDQERDAAISETLPMKTEPVPLPEPDIVIPDDHPLVSPGGLIQDPYEARADEELGDPVIEPPDEAPPDEASEERRCTSAGGRWNDCASPCRNLGPDAACIEMCISVCECGGAEEWTCPAGTVCTDYEPLPRSAASTGICQ